MVKECFLCECSNRKDSISFYHSIVGMDSRRMLGLLSRLESLNLILRFVIVPVTTG